MAQRQIVLFRIGCWAAIATALLHLAGHVSGPGTPANEVEQQLVEMAGSYQFELPGGGRRSLMEFLNGFSLSFALFLSTIGGLGLIVVKRGHADEVLLVAVARVLAAASVALLVISFTHWFIVPTICLTFVALSFALAAVPRPAPAAE
jgi:hypothetical protein